MNTRGCIFPVVFFAAFAARAFTLFDGGKSARTLVPAAPDESTKLAVAEWTNYVCRVTGAAPRVEVLGGDIRGAVVIGTLTSLGELVPAAFRAMFKGEESHDAFVTGLADGAWWILGREEVAELYGVYRTLEQQLGVRWFKPWEKDDPGEYVPRAAKVELPDAPRKQSPWFLQRHLDMTGSSVAYIPYNGMAWVYRAGLQTAALGGVMLAGPRPNKPGRDQSRWDFFKPRVQINTLELGGGHMTFVSPIPKDKFFDTHPEYFALKDGKRVKGEYYCHSNPDVQHILRDDIIRRLKATGGRGKYLFGLQDRIDSAGACECENCRALDSEAEKKEPLNSNISTRFHTMAANVAQEVYKAFPEADFLHTWAYNIYREPPADSVHFDPRMWVELCIRRCYGHRIDDPKCPKNVVALDWLRRWRKLIAERRCHTYEYGNCSSQFYVPYEVRFAHDLKVYRELGLAGWKEECHFVDSMPYSGVPKDTDSQRRFHEHMGTNWQWFYAAGKLLWEPDLKLEDVLEDAESKYYGAAYPAMKKYHALRRRLWDSRSECMGYPHGDARTKHALSVPGSKEALIGLLDKADALAGGDALVKRRISNDRRWLEEFWIGPSDKMLAAAGRAMRALRAAAPISVDGRGTEKAWGATSWTDAFLSPGASGAPAPKALATTAAVLSDEDNLYFLFRFRGASRDDVAEFSVFPPSEGNTYFDVRIDGSGRAVVTEHPGNRRHSDISVEAAVVTRGDVTTFEARLPVARIFPISRGDIWRVFFARRRSGGESFTLDGGDLHTTANYRPLEVGEPFLKNGGFEQLDEKGMPAGWSCRGGSNFSVVREGRGNAVRLVGGAGCHQPLGGGIKQSDKPVKIAYAFRAKGSGSIGVNFYRYHDVFDSKVKHRYRREVRPTESAGFHGLSDEMRTFSGEYVIHPGEWVSISIGAVGKSEVVLDDVSVKIVR